MAVNPRTPMQPNGGMTPKSMNHSIERITLVSSQSVSNVNKARRSPGLAFASEYQIKTAAAID